MNLGRTGFCLAVAGFMAPGVSLATNGMDMEGYGAVATGMGGASMAYDNGTAAMMNNPATLALMEQGSRADLAFGYLGPDVRSGSSRSSADAFSMPAFGWFKKRDTLGYGIGIYGQGGMGTEYGGSSEFSNPGNQAVSPNLVNRSELSVGRVILPLTYDLDPDLRIGGSLDYVWAGMDLQMALPGQSFLQLAGGTSPMGSAGGTMIQSFVTNVLPGLAANPVNFGYFDFSNQNKYTGQAVGTGYAGKIGFAYKVNPDLTIGATYHSRTRLGDLAADQATVLFNVNFGGGGPANQAIPVAGKIAVRNFQWPDTFGFGLAYQADEKLLVVADYKRINWAHTMRDFRMTFTAQGNTGLAAAFNGTSMDVTMFQNWRDQNVLMVGGAYRTTEALTLRAGLNLANNPVPDQYVNYLFPATIRNHVTGGFGYAFSKASSFDFSATWAPKVTVTSGVTGVTTSHEQKNFQLLYSYRY